MSTGNIAGGNIAGGNIAADKGVRITSVGWQVTLCDPIWQVVSQVH